jgi:DNA (cytosine-5)-methyltransferase 1
VPKIRAIDLFCGAGGSSWGARLAGVEVVAGFDAWDAAKDAFSKNFPNATFFHGFLEDAKPLAVKRAVGKIDLILASPECKSHSPAKGAAERSDRSRDTALQVVRFAKALKPRWIVIENVVSMRNWSGYANLRKSIERLGYQVSEQVLNAADFGVPQQRRRLFLMCDRECQPKDVLPTHRTHSAVSKVICMNGTYALSPLRTERRAVATLERADRAFTALGERRPFLLVYYGSDKAGGWQRLSRTLRTITTLDRFALVRSSRDGPVMRMLQVPELKQAMGMPKVFSLGKGSRRDHIHLIGNAVCPPVMRAIVRSLVNDRAPRKTSLR